jgi:hypothetical protein
MYQEQFKNSAYEKFAFNFCLANAWRVRDKLGDFDDCMAQCRLYFVEVQKFYEGKLNSPQHLMWAYRLWVTGQFHDLSKKDYKNRCTKMKLQRKGEISIKSEAEMVVILGEASSELKEVLRIFFNAPKEVMETISKDAKTAHSGKFFRHVVSFCGLAPERADDLAKELKDLLK